MMKFQTAINLGIASLLVIPAVALQSRNAGGLEVALEETVAALEHLAQVQSKLDAKDPQAVDLVLGATEEPMPAGEERDSYMTRLRRDVNVLAMQLERAERKSLETQMVSFDGRVMIDGTQPPRAPFDPSEYVSAEPGAIGPKVGLTPEERAMLSNMPLPLPGAEGPPQKPVSLEEEGFVADPVLLGRSYYRAGRFVEGAHLLASNTDPEARYWRGRCLERLERFDEAIEVYEAVLAAEGAGYLADRARNDLEFLKWKRQFQNRLQKDG